MGLPNGLYAPAHEDFLKRDLDLLNDTLKWMIVDLDAKASSGGPAYPENRPK